MDVIKCALHQVLHLRNYLAYRLIYIYHNYDYILNCVYPNLPRQLSLWGKLEHPEKTHDFRQSVDRLFHMSGDNERIEPTISEVKGVYSGLHVVT